MAFKSKGELQVDLKQIAIDRIGQEKYDALDETSIRKIDNYTLEQTEAIQAFLERQELNITDMEAVGMIQTGQIQVQGGVSSPAAIGGPVSLVSPASNLAPIPIRVQISQTSNKVGLPEVFNNVKKSAIKFLRTVL